MELDLAALRLAPGMAVVAAEVRVVRAQAVRLEDRRVTVDINSRANHPALFNL